MPETLPQQRRRWQALCARLPNRAEVIFICSDGWTIQGLPYGADICRVGEFLANCWQHTTPSVHREYFDDSIRRFCTLNDEDGIPRAAFFWEPGTDYISAPLRHHNKPCQREDWKRLIEWQPDSRSLKAVKKRFEPIVHPRQISISFGGFQVLGDISVSLPAE